MDWVALHERTLPPPIRVELAHSSDTSHFQTVVCSLGPRYLQALPPELDEQFKDF
jgi:hypothetical protein